MLVMYDACQYYCIACADIQRLEQGEDYSFQKPLKVVSMHD